MNRKQKTMLARIIAVSTLGGWLVIALWWNVVLPGRREAAHESHMLTGERETDTGELTVSRELQIIPKSAPLLLIFSVVKRNSSASASGFSMRHSS